jgi:hypothetical protein
MESEPLESSGQLMPPVLSSAQEQARFVRWETEKVGSNIQTLAKTGKACNL